MLNFTWYQHDWKEAMDTEEVNGLMKLMGGNKEIMLLDSKGDCYDYCIHNSGLNQKIIEQITEARHILEDAEGKEGDFFRKRFDFEKDLLSLEDKWEVDKLWEYALDVNLQRRKKEKVKKENSPALNKGNQAVKPYQNELGRIWQIVDKNSFYYDLSSESFTASSRGTTSFPTHQLAEQTIKDYDLKEVVLWNKNIEEL